MTSQSSDRQSPPAQNTSIAQRIPPAIVRKICDHVPNSTIKNLRFTCRHYSVIAVLRLNRIFISANPRNVEVFKAIAGHQTLRAGVTEIIWDDALLYGGPPAPRDTLEALEFEGEEEYMSDYVDDDESLDEDGIDWRGDVPGWFRRACRENIFELKGLKGDDVDTPGHIARAQQVAEQMPMEKAWVYYQELLKQQHEVLESGAHIHALEKHIGSFPMLQRITISAATHGRLFNPLYETPMIRAFPRGFNYRIPRGWPVNHSNQPECNKWDSAGIDWQGFRVVTRLLAKNKDSGLVTDLRIDANGLETGLNSRVFEWENDTFSDFKAVLARPNFKHLHLDLMVDAFERQADVFGRGLLKDALIAAAGGQGLEYFSFRTNTELEAQSEAHEWYVPLGTIFMPTSFTRLQHFGLSRFYVKESDLLALLALLPQSLRKLELSLIQFMPGEGSYRTLLWQMRDTLGWKERNPRPRVSISTETIIEHTGRSICVEGEVYDFLYEGGNNPFGDDPADKNPNHISRGLGWVKDSFDPEHERPNADYQVLADMGYIKDKGWGRWTARNPSRV